ncbi:MAG TPA: hypothetical protein VM870_09440, partial [Pyrinomonadaceae bacterium]|nr:hypothetical protein [Pyrinomonadaceae bacterium]
KDERSMVRYMMRQATADLKVRSATGGDGVEGRDLAKSLEQMVELKRMNEKLIRRLGGDDQLLEKILEGFAGRQGVLRKEGRTLRDVFQDRSVMAKVEGVLDKAGYRADLTSDEEHGLCEIELTNNSGVKVVLDWNLVSHVEFRRAIELYQALEERLSAPFVIGENGTSEQIQTRDALLERVFAVAKKDLTIQRYKGLGEMNPEQLWETTMNPERRTLLQVKIDDAVETDQIFTVLMGDAVEPRRRFIEDNALDVRNLDV